METTVENVMEKCETCKFKWYPSNVFNIYLKYDFGFSWVIGVIYDKPFMFYNKYSFHYVYDETLFNGTWIVFWTLNKIILFHIVLISYKSLSTQYTLLWVKYGNRWQNYVVSRVLQFWENILWRQRYTYHRWFLVYDTIFILHNSQILMYLIFTFTNIKVS
jgi:hypothetical protein